MIIKQTYDKIGFKERKSGKCPICGKQATRVKEFYQTISPWNQKTAEQIMKEERRKYYEWRSLPVIHAKCELSAST